PETGRRGMPVGTAVYSGPEMLSAQFGQITMPDDPTKLDTYSLGRMLDALHTGSSLPTQDTLPKPNADVTGALKDLHDPMTAANPADRPVLEAALGASYFRNLDNYDPRTVKELMAATVAYSKSLQGKKVDGRGVKEL